MLNQELSSSTINNEMLEKINELVSIKSMNGYDLGYLSDPRYGEWRLEKDVCQLIGKYCEEYRPEHVLEFGSGLSTLILAHEAEKGNVKKIWSIDHQKNFPGHPGEILEKTGQKSFVNLCSFPIRLKYFAGKLFQFYSIPKRLLKEIGKLDMVLIDGPPYYFHGREAALYMIFNLLGNESLVLLDDVVRQNREMKYIDNWHRYFGSAIDSIIYQDQFKKGLAFIWRTFNNNPIKSFPLRIRLGDSWAAFKRTISIQKTSHK